MAKQSFYAVRKGYQTGVFESWDEVQKYVKGFPGAEYKKFSSPEEADAWAHEKDTPAVKQESVMSEPAFARQEALDAVETLYSGGYLDKSKYEEIRAMILVGQKAPVKAPSLREASFGEDMPNVYMFVDGSYNPDTEQYGYGVYMSVNGKKRILSGSGPMLHGGRNVEGEVAAVMAGLQELRRQDVGFETVHIYHDYEGIGAWGRGDWAVNTPYGREYVDAVRAVIKGGMNLSFEHVKAHEGILGNEYVDVIAKEACGVPMTRKEKAWLEEAKKSVESSGPEAEDEASLQ